MSDGNLDPRWTDRSPSMRILDPIGAETTEGSLQDRLFRPVLSIAITQRLRYLSFWCWVTSNLDQHTKSERALYEKILLVPSTLHDCPSDGTGTNGIMGGAAEIQKTVDESEADPIDISSESFTIAGSDVARWDSYYRGVLYRLLLFENEWTVTPLGKQLATAYSDSFDVEFDELRTAVDNEELPIDLINRFQSGGCLCQLTTAEKQLLRQAYWVLVNPAARFERLEFDSNPHPDLLTITEYLDTSATARESQALVESTLGGTSAADEADYSENLELFFSSGRDAFVRGSLTLLLSIGDWVNRRSTPEPEFSILADVREVWRLLVHAEYASFAIQTLFICFLGAVRELEPISQPQLLNVIFGNQEFDRAAGQALAGVSYSEQEGGERSVLKGIRDAVYFDESPTYPLRVELADGYDAIEGAFSDVSKQLRQEDPESNPFELSERSERVYRRLIRSSLSNANSVDEFRRIAGYSSILVTRIATRYSQYFGSDQQSHFTDWFLSAHQHPGAETCWQLTESYPESAGIPRELVSDEWARSPFALTMAGFSQKWVLDHYFERLYEKIKSGYGKSPHLLHVDADNRLTFDHEINNGNLYNNGKPNSPTLKFARLGDILYELDLIEDNSLREMRLTEAGRKFIQSFGLVGDS